MATTERVQEVTAGSEASEVGQLVRDASKDKVGVIMGNLAGRYQLRPVHMPSTTPGERWPVPPDPPSPDGGPRTVGHTRIRRNAA